MSFGSHHAALSAKTKFYDSASPPKPSTVRALFAKSGNECAFPGCGQALVDDRNLFVGEVCHFNAVKDTEARYDAAKTAEELRAYENLILLCHANHVRVDSLPAEYPVVALQAMREQHGRSVEHKVYKVSDEIIDDALFQLLQSEWEPYFEPTVDYLIADIEEARGGQQGISSTVSSIAIFTARAWWTGHCLLKNCAAVLASTTSHWLPITRQLSPSAFAYPCQQYNPDVFDCGEFRLSRRRPGNGPGRAST